MKTIVIRDENIRAEIQPAFGGMVTSLRVGGKEVLRINRGNLGIANCLAGGIPVLFPFSSKVKDDTYTYKEKEYTMPMHGFVKDMPFSVESQTDDSVTVYTVPGETLLKECYPFDFILTIEYTVKGSALRIKARIENKSFDRMPYYLGWHTYFKTSDKKQTKFTFDFSEYTSYLDGSKGIVEGNTLDLSKPLDHVFTGIGSRSLMLENYADGYIAETMVDDMHEVLTVCTAFDDCACIEPWTAVPDAINTGEMLKFVEPKGFTECGFKIKVNIL